MKSKIVYFVLGASLLALQANSQVRQRGRQTMPKSKSVTSHTLADTALYPKLVTREVVQEVAVEKGATIHIDNSRRNLDIRLWPDTKVKIVTTVSVDEKHKALGMEDLMKEAGITLRSFGKRVDILATGRFEPSVQNHPSNTVESILEGVYTEGKRDKTFVPAETTDNPHLFELFDLALTQRQNSWSATGKNNIAMTIFIPEDSKLDVENRNTDILINGNIGDATFKLTRSNLDARSFKKLSVIAEYYHINISDVDDAELELVHGTFTAGIIKILDLDSEGSEIEYESGVNIYMRSKQDRITIDEIARVDGRKLYGELRLGKLTTSLDIEGIGADVKIRNISRVTEKIRLVNQYADLRLPVRHLDNYTVSFYGKNTTVFAPFEKKPVSESKTNDKEANTAEKSKTAKESEEFIKTADSGRDEPITFFNKLQQYNSLGGQKTPSKFTASVGTVTGGHTKFEIECHQCAVDFK